MQQHFELDVVGGFGFEISDFSIASDWEKLVASLEEAFRRLEGKESGGKAFVAEVEHARRKYQLALARSGDWVSRVLQGEESACVVLSGGSSSDARLLLSALVVASDATRQQLPVVVAWDGSAVAHVLRQPKALVLRAATEPLAFVPTLSHVASHFRAQCDAELAVKAPQRQIRGDVSLLWNMHVNPHAGWQRLTDVRPGSCHAEVSWGPDLDPVAAFRFATECNEFLVQGNRALVGEEDILATSGDVDPRKCPVWKLSAHSEAKFPSSWDWMSKSALGLDDDESSDDESAQGHNEGGSIPGGGGLDRRSVGKSVGGSGPLEGMWRIDEWATPLTSRARALLEAMNEAEEFDSMKTVWNVVSRLESQPVLRTMESIRRSILDPTSLPTAEELRNIMTKLFSPDHPSTMFPYELKLNVKSAPPLTLVASLCMYMMNEEGLPGIASIWQEFVRELRRRWDRFETLARVPGTPSGASHRYARLYQQIQMLNWCTQQRCRHNAAASGNQPEEPAYTKQLDAKLLATGAPVFEPVTQDPSCFTEDMLEEQQQLLVALGDDKEASEIRAQMQSRSLLSDMEAFRAVNPECVFEDFVRWHSSNDWITEPCGEQAGAGQQADGSWIYQDGAALLRGRLSSRMQSVDNLWNKLWKQSRPNPVSKQKSLVDYVKEGERILHKLEMIDPKTLLKDCALIVLTAVHHTFTMQPCALVPAVQQQLGAFAKAIEGMSRFGSSFQPEDLEVCVMELERLERVASVASSLLSKLDAKDKLVDALLRDGTLGHTVLIEGEEMRLVVEKLLVKFLDLDNDDSPRAYDQLPPPDEKEYLLSCTQQKQRYRAMYVKIRDGRALVGEVN